MTASKQNFYFNNLNKMLEQGYCLMPNDVLYSTKLTDKQKLLFCAISNLCAEKGFCWASNEYLGEKLNADARTIRRNISTLQESGFIKITVKNNNQREISLQEGEDKNVLGVGQKCPRGEDKNVHIILQENITKEKKENLKRKGYGEFGSCYLSEQEYEKVIREYGPKNGELLIKQVDNYCASKGKKYKNYVAAIRKFAENGGIKKLTASKQNEYEISDGVYDIDKLLNNLPS